MNLIEELMHKNPDSLTDRDWEMLLADEKIGYSFIDASKNLSSELQSLFLSIDGLKQKIETKMDDATLYSRTMLFSAALLMTPLSVIADYEMRISCIESCLGLVEQDLLSRCADRLNPLKPNSGLPFTNEDAQRITSECLQVLRKEVSFETRFNLIARECLNYIGVNCGWVNPGNGDTLQTLTSAFLHNGLKDFINSLLKILNKYHINTI